MIVTELKICELKEAEYNPRELTKKQYGDIRSSLTEFGFVAPVIVNQHPDRLNVIVGGHQRVKVWRDMGNSSVPTVSVSLPKPKEKQLNIRLNKNSGDWDWDILANEFEMDELIDWGFDEGELLGCFADEDNAAEDEQIPDTPETPITVKGDVYELGPHRLMCGDSTVVSNVDKLLDTHTPNLMVTDPPYGVNYEPEWREERSRGETAIGKVINDDTIDWSDAYTLFPGNVAYVWHAAKYTHIVGESIETCGFKLISNIIWAKQHFALSRGDYHWQHEPCWYAVRKEQKHNWQGKRDQSTLWQIDNNNFTNKNKEEQTGHSTQKPIKCMEIPITNNSKRREHIYDPFGGSGTTLIASEKTGRECLIMELDEKYCDVIVKRYVDYCKKNNNPYSVKRNGKECKDYG